ncbi:MAG: transcription-repair coupling factor, partial [Desulfofustis sp.]|nr:transcription-repair coupling factor [Desulfofustis sp.]
MPHYPPFIKDSTLLVTGLRGSSPAWYCAQAAADSPVCCILPDEQLSEGFEQDISFFTNLPVIAYPGYEIPAYTPLSPDQHTTAARLSALYHIMESRKPFILAVSIEALLRRVMPRHLLQQHAELLMEGEDFDHQKLRRSLVTMGYEQVALVKNFGDFSVRGGVVDIYPP